MEKNHPTALPDAGSLENRLRTASRKVAPLWPLDHFVAVNPFLGLAHQRFEEAAQTLARTSGARLTLPRSAYAEAIAAGRITAADLSDALAAAEPFPGRPIHAKQLADRADTPAAGVGIEPAPTVADVASACTGVDWDAFVIERVSAFAAAHYDTRMAPWRSPFSGSSLFAAWRAEASIDRTPEVFGLPGFRASVSALPDDRNGAAAHALQGLGVSGPGLDEYLHRLLMTISGWAGHARYQQWERELRSEEDTSVVDLLAVRLCYEHALLSGLGAEVHDAWQAAARAWEGPLSADPEHRIDLVLHDAYERAQQRRLAGTFARAARSTVARTDERPTMQAAFCIDVRSEIIRRAIEAVEPNAETIGFAGFFGFAIEYVPLGQEHGGARCPALLAPRHAVRESVGGAASEENAAHADKRTVRRRAADAWDTFKRGAISSFGFVETMGLSYAPKLVSDSLGWTRPVAHPGTDGVDRDLVPRLGPLTSAQDDGRFGMTGPERVDTAEGLLRGMSLVDRFAPVVLLVGHGATTVNNPYHSGLDCGACGGHPGDANARLAAGVLNDPTVRSGLAERGIVIPDDTMFLGALHDTTTDEVRLFVDAVPAARRTEVDRLRAQLAEASMRARVERAERLDIAAGSGLHDAVLARSRDWSQVRPEWGLAGCSAFIVAPRHRTATMTLDGRAFLHSYDWARDDGFGVLEAIMTAPMVVGSWINLQYFASAVAPRVFGSGNKTLHNVVSGLGVLEGNGGDLRTGLPWQSVHDGEAPAHEPLRLSVLIEAPVEAMTDVVRRHAGVRELLDGGWLTLFAIDASGRLSHRYEGDLRWRSLSPDEAARAAA